MLFMFLLMAVAIVLVGGGAKHYVNYRNAKALGATGPKELAHLSWPAKMIVASYKELPQDSRPYPNIVAIVSALDVKYGADTANQHFQKQEYRPHGPRRRVVVPHWEHRSYSSCYNRCAFAEYKTLFDNIQTVKDSLAEKEYALAVAAVSGSLTDAKELSKALEKEAELQRSITQKHLT